jgi:hypothetical protein
MLNTVAEVPAYRSLAEKHLSAEERQTIIDYPAGHPEAGVVMQGTGGERNMLASLVNKLVATVLEKFNESI